LKGDVRVELSKKGEKITTLDGVERALPDGAIILKDDLGIFDLMGIMGGLRSSTKPTTKRIYLHAPRVDPQLIRKAIIATGLRTDAGTVYEKGVPNCMVEHAVLRAAQLMIELIPGAKLASSFSSHGTDGKTFALPLSLAGMERTLGKMITEKEATEILTDLGFSVKRKSKSKDDIVLNVTVPLHRLGDVRTTYDLVEEVARIYGYDAIPSTIPNGDLTPPKRDDRVRKMRNALQEAGFTELLPLSLTSKAMLEKSGVDVSQAVQIENPLGEELGTLHTHTLPALLEHAARNVLESTNGLQTFHWGHVFSKKIAEHPEMTILCVPPRGTEPKLANLPVLWVKAAVMHVCAKIGMKAEISQEEAALPAHPGRSAKILVDGTDVGTVYEVHPEVLSTFDLPSRTAAATIDLSKLLSLASKVRVPEKLPAFPPVSYDETLPISAKTSVGTLMHDIQKRTPLLTGIETVDLYEGSPTDRRVTIRFTYRSPERTLTEAEVKKEHEGVLATLKNHLS
jgi:phenylalanyl-tRNA synthetase beta chain